MTAFDIRNYNRIVNTVVDIGPYEFNSAILPVHLTRFSGRPNGHVNILSWATASENNHHSFDIQRSADGIVFEKIGEVAGSANSMVIREYSFTDDKLFAEQYYYRLKQTDIDHRYIFSHTISLVNTSDKKNVLIFPNPVVRTAIVLFRAVILANEEFLLIDKHGQVVDKLIVNGRATSINLQGKAAGMYILMNRKQGIAIKICKTAE